MNKKKFEKKCKPRVAWNPKKCKCGHTVDVFNKYDRFICSWCGEWIYANEKAKFKYELEKVLKRKKYEANRQNS